jgi:aspartate aminotransferase/aminotransferase
MHDHWIAERMGRIDSSGIRKVFELARTLKNPVNLSIGQPDFDVPEPIKAAAHVAIDRGFNGYTASPGIPELRTKLLHEVQRLYPRADRDVFITSGSTGGLALAMLCVVNPGDEVVIFDPYFVLYPHLVSFAGGKPVIIDTYPNFEIDLDKVRAALSPKTKAIIVNSPANPTGNVCSTASLRDLAQLAHERGILLLSDEIYRAFCYDVPFCSPAEFNDDVLVFDGFSKAYGMTGWRLGYVHGPRRLIDEMIKLQQYTYVCAPSIVQQAGVTALDYDVSGISAAYGAKRDRLYDGIKDRYDVVKPNGAFYLYPKAPRGSGTEFVAEAIRNNLLCIPGNVFSHRDTHFRLSYAADDAVIDCGIEILNRLA